MEKQDIVNENDVANLVRTFYNRLLSDELMSPHFKGIDFEHHFPRMIGFWSFILLDKTGFEGNVFDKHRHLKIGDAHFERWIATFCQTVDDLHAGETAEKAKQQAKVIGMGFQWKMKYQ
jgi:hemoglobin